MRVVAFLLLAAVLCMGAVWAVSWGDDCHEVETETVVVSRGDTLWEIAEGLCCAACDVREVVYQIRETNGGSALIRPGQTLEVPRRCAACNDTR